MDNMIYIVTMGVILLPIFQIVSCGCNEKIPVKPNEVIDITSPNYPANFSEYVDCYYELYVASDNRGLVIYVDVLDITLDCMDKYAQLKVFDEFSRNPKTVGYICKGEQSTFRSPKQSLYLTFRSRVQYEARSRGFRLRVRSEPIYSHCYKKNTVIYDVAATPTILATPYYPHAVEANVDCHWLLKAPSGSRINVTILDADMKGSDDCRKFAFYIYDGKTTYDDSLLTSLCDNHLGSFQSSGPYMLMIFTSGQRVYNSGTGIKLQYSSIPALESPGDKWADQTLFFIITALLIMLIIVIAVIAIFKIFILPSRRKSAARRRRESRARLTRQTSRSSNQSDPSSSCPCGLHRQPGPFILSPTHSASSLASLGNCRGQSDVLLHPHLPGNNQSEPSSRLPHDSDSRIFVQRHSPTSNNQLHPPVPEDSSSLVGRFLSYYGLKKSRRSCRRPSPRTNEGRRRRSEGQGVGSECVVGISGYLCYNNGAFERDLPPPYEEAVRQNELLEAFERTLNEESAVQCSHHTTLTDAHLHVDCRETIIGGEDESGPEDNLHYEHNTENEVHQNETENGENALEIQSTVNDLEDDVNDLESGINDLESEVDDNVVKYV